MAVAITSHVSEKIQSGVVCGMPRNILRCNFRTKFPRDMCFWWFRLRCFGQLRGKIVIDSLTGDMNGCTVDVRLSKSTNGSSDEPYGPRDHWTARKI